MPITTILTRLREPFAQHLGEVRHGSRVEHAALVAPTMNLPSAKRPLAHTGDDDLPLGEGACDRMDGAAVARLGSSRAAH